MKRITICGKDEIIDDIKATAHKLQMSASRYMIHLHAMKQGKIYHGEVRGSNVARETGEIDKSLIKKRKKSIQDIRDEADEKLHLSTRFSGGIPKNKDRIKGKK